MNSQEIFNIAQILDIATLEKREIERITLKYPQLELSQAYAIQESGIQLRIERGDRPIGFKMGLTSLAKREQMNLDSSIYGVLTQKMKITGSDFSLSHSIHPRIEPEIAFFIQQDIQGSVTPERVLDACSGVCGALEIIDSRFLHFKYFSLPDVIADNCSSSYFLLSKTIKKPRDFDLSNLEMSLEVNGSVVQSALSKEISQNPVNSVVQLCSMLAERGAFLAAGSIVLAGAATQAIPLEKGSAYTLKVQNLGAVSLRITPD